MSAHQRRRFLPDIECLEERVVPANATTAGALTFPFPTLNSISVDWAISGDDNNNGVVTVQYRQQGSGTWLQGMNLQRIPAGTNTTNGVTWPNVQSGSIVDLQPNTTYEIQVSLTDPDGGSTTPAIQTVTTRPVPTLTGLRTVNVTPSTFASALNNAQPGDVIDLAAGTYNGPFSGSKTGTAANPIIIRSSSGGAILQGDGTNALDLSGLNYYHVDGLQINNGRIKLNNAIGSAVTNCIIHTPGNGVVAYSSGGLTPQNLYIADNQLFGSGTWQDSQVGANGNDDGDGIEIGGPGNVVMNNYVHGFRDDISLEDGELAEQHDIDILNNDIDLATDDGIEADWTQGNVRIMRNRITNAFDGISSQPAFGGPTYMIRNVMYNVLYTPFKLHNNSVGNIILNNSVVKNGDALGIYAGAPISESIFANNLFIGGPGGTYGGFSNGSGRVIDVQDADSTDSFENDAFGSTLGTFNAKIGSSGLLTTVAQVNALTNVDGVVQIDLSVFAASVAYPTDPISAELPAADLRLAAGSAAINAGEVIPNVTDGYAGSAPDIGAYEFGAAVPVYGPRTSPSNQPPTVATAASATPSPATGTTTTLSVLGADDGGEANLTYTWATTGTPPAGVTFSANGTNAAKSSVATFTKAGTYSFQVTIKDSANQTVASSVNVTVNQTLTLISVTPASVNLPLNGTQQYSAIGKDQFGTNLTAQPSFTWSIFSGPGGVNSSGLFTASSTAGTATIQANSGAVNGTATAIVGNTAPTVVTAAKATPSPVTGTTTTLSVLGADDGGEANLVYTWATTGSPPATVTFSTNGTNAAKSSVATFTKAGTYSFQVTIKDAGNQTVTSSVNVTVNQTLTTIVVSPNTVNLPLNGTQQYTATGKDQFGTSLTAQPTFTWSMFSGPGGVSSTGLYTATTTTGTATIQAANGAISGTATAIVGNNAPTVAAAASALPSPVNGTTTTLSVLGADDGGEANLVYTWATTGTPPATVTFSANGTNAAKNSVATFTKAGTYSFQVTIKDASNQTVTSSVNVTVNQTLTTIVVSPNSVNLPLNGTQQYSATGMDQFGTNLTTQPSFAWSIFSGPGGVNSSGLYTASSTAGTATIEATSGAINGTATAIVGNTAPTVFTAAKATPSPVTGATTALSVLGADDGGEANLVYTWATTGSPPAAVTFSVNGTNAAKNSVATFTKAGSYSFQVTIKDASNQTVTTSVNVTVNQTLTSITVSPASANLPLNGIQQFSATAKDQFGTNLISQPTFTWSIVSGLGSVSPSGLYTAGATTGSATVKAANGAVSGVATVATTFSLDVDANGTVEALTDGILILRYLFGFTGTTLTTGALGAGATRTSSAAIVSYLASSRTTMLDPDGNGNAAPLTDGILILRYLFGFTGTALTSNAIGAGATRTDPVVIQTYLDSYNPTLGHLWADSVGNDAGGVLTPEQLQTITQAAVVRWEATDISAAARAKLESASVQLADLGGASLGQTHGNTVLIDQDAAGHGWFVDNTPLDDSEFTLRAAPYQLEASPGSAAANHMDLLTVVMHELGIVMGLKDIDPAVQPHMLMTDVLGSGSRMLTP